MGLSFFVLINYLNAQSHLFICLADLNCGMWDLGPCLGTELGPPALEARSLSHWTTTEVLTWGIRSSLCHYMENKTRMGDSETSW